MEPENTPKVIELKEFVEEAISQIVDGITAAQKRVETSGAIVSPRKSNSKNNVEIEGKLYSVQNSRYHWLICPVKVEKLALELLLVLGDSVVIPKLKDKLSQLQI